MADLGTSDKPYLTKPDRRKDIAEEKIEGMGPSERADMLLATAYTKPGPFAGLRTRAEIGRMREKPAEPPKAKVQTAAPQIEEADDEPDKADLLFGDVPPPEPKAAAPVDEKAWTTAEDPSDFEAAMRRREALLRKDEEDDDEEMNAF